MLQQEASAAAAVAAADGTVRECDPVQLHSRAVHQQKAAAAAQNVDE